MALYKVTKAEDAFQYFPPGHFDVRCTRLHTADDLEGGKLTRGLSHFLPEGGAEMAEATLEMCYYIQKGEMTVAVENDNTEYVLHAGDSIRFMPGTKRAPKNTGIHVAEMLVMMLAK